MKTNRCTARVRSRIYKGTIVDCSRNATIGKFCTAHAPDPVEQAASAARLAATLEESRQRAAEVNARFLARKALKAAQA
jgi:hypothetical protein